MPTERLNLCNHGMQSKSCMTSVMSWDTMMIGTEWTTDEIKLCLGMSEYKFCYTCKDELSKL